MKIEEAIKQSIKGRWGEDIKRQYGYDDSEATTSVFLAQALQQREPLFLDPLFWQSLGKALGWGGMGKNEDTGKIEWIDALRCPRCGDWLMGELQECGNECDWDGSEIDAAHGNLYEYRYQWHRLIDHLAEGKTAKDFFETL